MNPEFVRQSLSVLHGIDVEPELAEQIAEGLATLRPVEEPPRPPELSLWDWDPFTAELERMR